MRQLRLLGGHFNNTVKQFIVLVLVLLSVQVPDVLAQYVSAEPEIFLQSVEERKAEAQSVFRARLKLAGKSSISVTSILLDPLSEQEQETIRSAIVRQDTTKKRKVGIGRSVPSPYCDAIDPGLYQWISLPEGGRAAVFSVKSPEAAALRVEIKVIHMPKGAEFRFYNPTNPEEVYGPYLIDQIRDQMVDNSFWSPVIEGNSIAIEIFLPKGLECDDLSIAIPQVSHLWSSVLNPCGERRLSDIGTSGYCNIDVACTDWVGSYAEQSVAKMLFTEGWYTYACTGTVLNDKDPSTYIPYFLTANHCISTQAAASSLITYWNFQKSSCYGPNPGTVTQLTGGAKLLSTGSSTDYTLLRLYQNPPPGTAFAGWTTAPVDYGSEVVGIHHPQGDLKKISFGTAQGFRYCTSGDQFICYPGNGGYIAIGWYSGITEVGSSGSALFDDQGYVIGSLRGGASSCQNPDELDFYGRFDLTYPLVKQWLGETSASDTTPPDASIVFGPSGIIDYSNVTFTYTGSDDVTQTSNLLYSYKLEGYDSNWSDYSSATSKTYNGLPNNSYIFKVKAKDAAGNIDPTPASRSFTVEISSVGIRIPIEPTLVEIKNISPTPVCPTTDDPLAQPLAAGSVAIEGNQLTISVNYPKYEAPVDIYVGIDIPTFGLWTFDKNNNLTSGLITPWRTDTTDPLSEKILDIPIYNPITGKLWIPQGTYTFYSAVLPADGNWSKYDITWFSVNIPPMNLRAIIGQMWQNIE